MPSARFDFVPGTVRTKFLGCRSIAGGYLEVPRACSTNREQ